MSATQAPIEALLTDSGRREQKDRKFSADVQGGAFTNFLFVRLVAKGRRFTNVDFRYAIFDSCYLRACSFDQCDFTGCRFLNSNLHQSTFSGCKFDYAVFERTLVSSEVLDNSCPGPENLKQRLARTLRMNFQQLGDSVAVNKAIHVELEATESHLRKAWNSRESYYRSKYKGWDRFRSFLQWCEFRLLDFIWGNGESTWKLLRTVVVILFLVALVDLIRFRDYSKPGDYTTALCVAPQLLLGTEESKNGGLYLAFLMTIRLIVFALFMSVVIKRFNRR